LRQGPDQLFLFFSYRYIVFHNAILYNYNMTLSRDELLKSSFSLNHACLCVISQSVLT
jgi:hypothetical protein